MNCGGVFHTTPTLFGALLFMETKIPYQFTAVPTKLCRCLDKNCNAMLIALIELHSLYANSDGWFFRSNKDLQDDADLSQNLVKVVLDTLYRAGIINVFCVGKGKGHTSNRIHINFESFIKYEAYSFNDIRNNPDIKIHTLPYKDHFTPSYSKNSGESKSEEMSETTSENLGEEMTTIIDTTNTPDTSNTITNSYSIDTILNNIIIKEEDPSGIETDIPKESIDLSEEAMPVVPKASFPNKPVEGPRYSYSVSTDIRTEKQKLLDECLKSFLEDYKEKIDIQLLKQNPQQFYDYNELKIVALSKQILIKTQRNISKQGIVLYLKDYVERYELSQQHERTKPA